MAFHQRAASAHATLDEGLGARLGDSFATLLAKIRASIDACGDYYAAAALYEQLSALSDAELARRGLSRATLAHAICAVCDRRVFE